jgi:Tol biopolymer transport system component/DNA-binding winged helix-turn-helix (wHTH) protein
MVMRKQVRHLYEFGPFSLDSAERLLTCDGKVVSLAPKLLETLLVLVENSGRIMEKEELLKILWPDSYVEESNLTTYVSQLRKALGEHVEGQSYIETVPRRGYRFIAEVKKISADASSPAVSGFVIHERTDTRILIEEEISDDEPGGETIITIPQHLAVEQEENLTPPPHSQVSPAKKVGVVLISSSLLILLAVGIYFWVQRIPITPKSASPFQRMTITKLTANGKIPLAAISPDGKYVAYVLQETPNQSLWLRQTSTTSNVQILPPAGVRFLSPTYSPDGTFIYYVTYQGAVGSLYQVPALGGTPRKLIEDVDSPVTFAPDGKRLAFLRHNPAAKESSLIVADTEGAHQSVLLTRKSPTTFSQDSLGHYAPSWSPDGQVIACSVVNEDNGSMTFNVIAVQVEEKTSQLLTEHKWHWAGQVAWLPDGKGLVANAWEQGTSTVSDQIWHIAYPSGEATRVTNDVNSYKGLSVAAKTGTLVTVQAAQVSRLWVMPTGNEPEALPITAGFGENYSEFLGIDWTKDNRIVYGSNASGNADIWIMDQDGQNQKQLTSNAEKDLTPVVSADGRYIVFVNFQGRTPHIFRMDVDGSNPKQLTNGQGEVTPTISPDGQWVAYSAYDGTNQRIFKVSIDGGAPVQMTEVNHVRPEYSPDGKWLACMALTPESGGRKIVILPANGGAPAKTIDQISLQRWSYLHWLSDSSALTVAGTQNGVSNIYKISLESGLAQPITNFKSDWIFRYAWSKDGKHLAVERGLPISDVIMISDFK